VVKPTMAMVTNNFIKPTEIKRKKPDENARIKPSKVEPAQPAPFVDETTSSYGSHLTAPTNSHVAASAAAPVAAATVSSRETNETKSQVKPVPLASSVDKTALSGDHLLFTNAPVTASAAAATQVVQSEEKNETDNEVESAPPTPPVPKSVPSKETSLPTNVPATASAAAPAAVSTIKPEAADKMDSKVKLTPMAPPVSKTAPPEDSPAPASASLLPVPPDVEEKLEALAEEVIIVADAMPPLQKHLQQIMKTVTNTLDTGTPLSVVGGQSWTIS
jgi:hypothetical protein